MSLGTSVLGTVPLGASPAEVAGDTSLAGAALSAASASGTLTTGVALSSAALSAASASGTLTTGVVLSGDAAGTSTATAALGAVHQLDGYAQAESGAAGALTTGIILPAKGRPSADLSAGPWLPSTGSSLYGVLDEATQDDADYIYTNAAGACEMALSPTATPTAGVALNYSLWSPLGNDAVVRLKQGATVIATRAHTSLPTTSTVHQLLLSPAEQAAITDYSALRIELEAL